MTNSNVVIKETSSDKTQLQIIAFARDEIDMKRPDTTIVFKGREIFVLNDNLPLNAVAVKSYTLSVNITDDSADLGWSKTEAIVSVTIWNEDDADLALEEAKAFLRRKAWAHVEKKFSFLKTVPSSSYSHWKNRDGLTVTIEKDAEGYPITLHPTRLTKCSMSSEIGEALWTDASVHQVMEWVDSTGHEYDLWSEDGVHFGYEITALKGVEVPEEERVIETIVSTVDTAHSTIQKEIKAKVDYEEWC